MSQRRVLGHALIALGAGLSLLVLASGIFRAGSTGGLHGGDAIDIGIEHRDPLRVRLRVTKEHVPGLFQFSFDATSPITLHVPAAWKQREVRNVPVASVSSKQSDENTVSYTLPPGTIVSYEAPTAIGPLNIHNVSSAPLTIRYEKVDIDKGGVERDVVLLQEGYVHLK